MPLHYHVFLVDHARRKTWVCYTPYDSQDVSKPMVSMFARSCAAAGCHFVTIDVHGTGQSTGTWVDEYTEREQQRLDRLMNHLAAQPWCASLSMMGFSYSGCAALQAAVRLPLDSIIPLFAGLSNEHNDVWLSNNVPLLADLFGYAFSELPYTHVRTQRRNVSDVLLRQRLTSNRWVTVDPRDIQCPVLGVSGWADTYVRSVFQMYEHTPHCSIIVGPWEHNYPMSSGFGEPLDLPGAMSRWMSGQHVLSCQIYLMKDLSCHNGQWFGSQARIKPHHRRTQVHIEQLVIRAQRTPLIHSSCVFESECSVRPAAVIHSLYTLGHIRHAGNICGNVDIAIRGIPAEHPPFLVCIQLWRASHVFTVSHCVYNPRRKVNAAKSVGVMVEPGDSLTLAFDLNTFPYTWNARVTSESEHRFSDVDVTVAYTEFMGLTPLSPIPTSSTKDMLAQLRWETPNRVVLQDTQERLVMESLGNTVRATSDVRYNNVHSVAVVQSADGGHTFAFQNTVSAHGKVHSQKGTFNWAGP